MTREEKILLAIEKGYTCNPETGQVFGVRGKEINSKIYGYIRIQINHEKKKYKLLAHHFIWYCIHKEIVDYLDHINRVRDDNRIVNLRSVTNQENGFNRKAKGYYWNKNIQKWRSHIRYNDKSIHLGYFNTEADARDAYLNAKKIYHII